jgi:L-alanine-DL-glutamate epimerase-like enolase superfamily enzyme
MAILRGRDVMDVNAAYAAMISSVRNLGRPGIAAMAISAADIALWDLKARVLDRALVDVLGAARGGIAVYGSGGFCSYDRTRLCTQLANWVAEGIPRVKMKVGRRPEEDPQRVAQAREAIGAAELFVDGNGAYTRKQALAWAANFHDFGVWWFEEPVTSDDLEGLRMLRDRGPAGMNIAAGEYGYSLNYFDRMLGSGAVDVLQADASRCGGITGFLGVAALCEARSLPLSAHCCPSLHLHLCCAVRPAIHLEYFHDHVRIEHMLFDGAAIPQTGLLYPDRSRPGLGIALKKTDAARFAL